MSDLPPRSAESSGPAGDQTRWDVIAVVFAALLVVIPQYVINVTQPNLDWTVFAYAVVLPAVVGSAVLFPRRERVYLYLFLAYLPSLTDDSPVNLDSVYTWPEVTSGVQHVATEILLHALTLTFLVVAVRAAFRLGGNLTFPKSLSVWLLTVAAFGMASVSIIPLPSLQAAIAANWYPFDVLGHVASLGLMCAALLVAVRK